MIRLTTALIIRMTLAAALVLGLLSGPMGVSVAHAEGLVAASSLMAEGGDTVVTKNQKDAVQQDAEQSAPQQKQKSDKPSPHEAFDHVHDAPGLLPTFAVTLPELSPVAPAIREIEYRSTPRLDHYRPPRTSLSA